MTSNHDAIEIEVDWMDYGKHTPECRECAYFKHNHCDNPNSDHYGHMLMPFHYACSKEHFMEKN